MSGYVQLRLTVCSKLSICGELNSTQQGIYPMANKPFENDKDAPVRSADQWANFVPIGVHALLRWSAKEMPGKRSGPFLQHYFLCLSLSLSLPSIIWSHQLRFWVEVGLWQALNALNIFWILLNQPTLQPSDYPARKQDGTREGLNWKLSEFPKFHFWFISTELDVRKK